MKIDKGILVDDVHNMKVTCHLTRACKNQRDCFACCSAFEIIESKMTGPGETNYTPKFDVYLWCCGRRIHDVKIPAPLVGIAVNFYRAPGVTWPTGAGLSCDHW